MKVWWSMLQKPEGESRDEDGLVQDMNGEAAR